MLNILIYVILLLKTITLCIYLLCFDYVCVFFMYFFKLYVCYLILNILNYVTMLYYVIK